MNLRNPLSALNQERHAKASFVGGLRACRSLAAKSGCLKKRLIERFSEDSGLDLPVNLVRQAVGDAEALAWATPYPTLFLPELAMEKVHSAKQWMAHQRRSLGI